jgi:hypothetical protein
MTNAIKMVKLATAAEALNKKTLNNVRGMVKRTLKWQDALAEELALEGLTTRELARPYAVIAVAELYELAKVEEGQRGYKLPRDSESDKALGRFLCSAFGSDNPFAGKGGSKAANGPVALPRGLVSGVRRQIVAAGLTKAQFVALLKQLREEITFA